MVDRTDCLDEGGTFGSLGLEGEADSDEFERVGEEDGRDSWGPSISSRTIETRYLPEKAPATKNRPIVRASGVGINIYPSAPRRNC